MGAVNPALPPQRRLRNRVLALVLLPLLGVLPLLGLVLLWWSTAAVDGLLRTKVRADLAVAHGYFERTLAAVGAGVGAVADSAALDQALQAPRPPDGLPDATDHLLQRVVEREQLDFLHWQPASDLTNAAVRASTSVELLAPEALRQLAPSLSNRVAVEVRQPQGTAPVRTEQRAMVLLAVRPVRDAQGQLRGVLKGGVLLNRNLDFIDRLNEIVYPAGSLPLADWGVHGTATLFLDDVRISTNVRLFRDSADRAIGTQVSPQVREAVLTEGGTWLDRAYVVNDWYWSGYQPLQDGQGRRIGMLYVGVLERPFTALKYLVLAGIGALFFAVMVAATVMSLRWARGIFKPIEQMEATMRRIEGGQPDARVGEVATDDELGRLATHLDALLDAIARQTRQLQAWNAELDAKVAERTAALQAAQAQLVHSEKLALMGQLTASIAHEVNNPIAVIQGNLDLLRVLLGPQAALVDDELRLVDEQVARMRVVTTQLLQFAKPAEFASTATPVDTAELLDACLGLARHQMRGVGVEVVRDYRATRQPQVNRHELQQVVVNLVLNALLAMEGGGRLRLATVDTPEGVQLTVADSGPGLAPDLLPQLFQPFVTRRKDGTGLGLWISRSLVQRYGGELRAANGEAGGAVFTIDLPA